MKGKTTRLTESGNVINAAELVSVNLMPTAWILGHRAKQLRMSTARRVTGHDRVQHRLCLIDGASVLDHACLQHQMRFRDRIIAQCAW